MLRRRLVPLNVAAYHHRDLQSSNSTYELYRVTLVLALSYLNDAVALNLESMDSSNELVSHFCMAVNTQVRRVIISLITLIYLCFPTFSLTFPSS